MNNYNDYNDIILADIPIFRVNDKHLGDFRGRLNGVFPKELMGEPKRIQLLFNFEFYPEGEAAAIEKTQPLIYSTKPGTPYYEFMAALLRAVGYEDIGLEELVGIEGVLTIAEQEYQGKIYENIIQFVPDMQEIIEEDVQNGINNIV